MSEQQVWRVVLATGEVREVVVEPHDSDWTSAPSRSYFARWAKRFAGGDTPRDAIVRLASDRRGADGWPVVEILAPGEPTRAEAVAAARREGAEAMRKAAVAMVGRRVAAWDDDADEHGDEDAATRWEEATEIRNAIRALPLPGDATPEHAPTPGPVCPAPTEGA